MVRWREVFHYFKRGRAMAVGFSSQSLRDQACVTNAASIELQVHLALDTWCRMFGMETGLLQSSTLEEGDADYEECRILLELRYYLMVTLTELAACPSAVRMTAMFPLPARLRGIGPTLT